MVKGTSPAHRRQRASVGEDQEETKGKNKIGARVHSTGDVRGWIGGAYPVLILPLGNVHQISTVACSMYGGCSVTIEVILFATALHTGHPCD